MTRLLTRADVASLLTLEDCLSAVEEAFRGDAASAKSLGFHAAAGTFHIKAAMGDVFATKINANFPGNPSGPTIQGVIVVMDLGRGTPLAILDSGLITTMRTAAATAVAVRHLARGDATTLTIIGCGVLGRATLDALKLVRPLSGVWAWDVSHAAASRLGRVPDSLDEAIASSDIVVTCTTSRSPILDAHHLHPGLFIAATGADNPQKQELAPSVLAQSKVVVDVLEQAATMGDLHHALHAGVMTREDVHGALGDVLHGRVPGRVHDDEVFVFDSTGTALQDVAVASLAYARAVQRGVGLDIALS
jgi:ornithine cyclodeaminase/alanine dehydrogenase-like protein (mu-crystallin family)